MLLETQVNHVNYWKKPFSQWSVNTWDQFYFEQHPNESMRSSHRALDKELEMLIKNLEPKTRKGQKALDLKRELKKSERNNKKKNKIITSTKKKVIEKIDESKKKPKTKDEKDKREEEQPDEDSTISITTPVNHASEISSQEIVLYTIPNLVYLDLRDKSNSTIESTEQRFPNEITDWLDFKQKVQMWQPEGDKKYKKPIFKSHNVTCEKDIWIATDVNVFDILTPYDQPISFLDGRALKNIVGEPDFIIVDNNIKMLIPWESKTKWVLNVFLNQNIVTLYNEEKEIREMSYTYSNDASVYNPINQIYGYMCANELRYGVLSTYNQTWFLERGVTGEDYGWLHVSDAITNTSTDPTLLKSVAYIISLASNDCYAPFLKKPTVIADDVDADENEENDETLFEKNSNKEFKYNGKLITKEPNVTTRSQSRQAFGTLNI